MSTNYVDQYKDEVSESSIVEEDDHKDNNHPQPQLPRTDPRPETSSKETSSRDKGNEIAPYTFDPQAIIKESQNAGPTSLDKKYGANLFTQKPLGYSPSEPGFGSSANFSYGKFRTKDSYTTRIGDQLSQRQSDLTSLTALGDLEECRRTEDYKGFAQEFDKEFTSDQKEMEQVSKDLMMRTKKLEAFKKELEGADLDMILFRSRLVREIDDVQNDLKEAYNNILVLLGDRSGMKDQFCLFKMKLKKLKSFIKTYQDDIQAYLFTYITIGEML